MTDWDDWSDNRPELETHEHHTVTILWMLSKILATAPFPWGLTGGTALQSYFELRRRRYSNDIEIITPARKSEVIKWMGDQEWGAKQVGRAPIVKAGIKGDGTLFVIHDYDKKAYEKTSPMPQIFRHYPIDSYPPPEKLTIPLLDYDFLMATKIYGVRDPRRGGERFKDAYDLAVGLQKTHPPKMLSMIGTYLDVRKDKTSPKETLRQSGAWMRHFLGAGRPQFEAWQSRFVTDPGAFDPEEELRSALRSIERIYGGPIQPSPAESRRFLMAEVPLKKLAPVAKKLGYEGSLNKEFEKMADFVSQKADQLGGPPPETAQALLVELQKIASEGRN